MKKLPFLALALLSMACARSQPADSAGLLYRRGLEEFHKRLLLTAYGDLRHSLDLEPRQADAQRIFGQVAFELRRFAEAEKAFLQLAELLPEDSSAASGLATIYFWNHQWAQAEQYGQKAAQLHAAGNWNWLLGKSYYEQEDYVHAFPFLQAASRMDSSNAQIPYLLARAFVDMNNYKPAIAFYQRAISLDSTQARWIYECALTLATVYQDRDAIRYYQLAVDKGYVPDNDYYENLADSYIAAGMAQQGLDLTLRILDKKPADLELLYSAANIYYKMGKYDLAIDYWDRVLSFDKENARALYMIGMSYQKKGDSSKGRQLCDKAIAMDPSLRNLKQERRVEM
jgi:tetratricopeptide (TPR) repeat protein